MLVLTRKVDQEIVINGNIKIRVLKMKGNSIRLGIEAPQEVDIVRGEITCTEREPTLDVSTIDTAANFSIVLDTKTPPTADCSVLLPHASSTEVSQNGADRTNCRTSVTDPSVEFSGTLPTPFQHNRLREIVNQMTNTP